MSLFVLSVKDVNSSNGRSTAFVYYVLFVLFIYCRIISTVHDTCFPSVSLNFTPLSTILKFPLSVLTEVTLLL